MTYQEAWENLEERIDRAVGALEELLETAGEHETIRLRGKIEGLKLMQSYMDDNVRTFVKAARSAGIGLRKRPRRYETDTRTLHGVGHDEEDNRYEVVRYDKAGKWWLEWDGGYEREVTVKEAVEAAEIAKLGMPGGAFFDRLWMKKALGDE